MKKINEEEFANAYHKAMTDEKKMFSEYKGDWTDEDVVMHSTARLFAASIVQMMAEELFKKGEENGRSISA